MSTCTNCGAVSEAGRGFCTQCGRPLPASAPDQAEGSLAGYELRGVLGQGATGGVVYLAWQKNPQRFVALKALDQGLADLPEFDQRFSGEARILESMTDQNVVGLYDYFHADQRSWTLSEFVSGSSLRTVIQKVPKLAPEQALVVLDGALDGISNAHGRGVLHGDIKPENILVDRKGVSKVSDFAQVALRDGTLVGGSPAYMSPEAADGVPIDERSDVYSAGVVLYELLAGRPLFTSPDDPAMIRMQAVEVPPPIPDLPEALNRLVGRALSKDPAGRPQSAAEFKDELERAATSAYGTEWRHRGEMSGIVAETAQTVAELTGSQLGGAAVPPNAPIPGGVAAGSSGGAGRGIGSHKVVAAVVALVVVAAAVVGIVLGTSSSKASVRLPTPKPTSTSRPGSVASPSSTTVPTTTPVSTTPTTSFTGGGASARQQQADRVSAAAGCPSDPSQRVNNLTWSAPPPQTIDTSATYQATLKTDAGSFVITLYPKDAPVAVNNFVFLAEQGYFNCVIFHRVIPGFVIQGGDPTGTGTGGPGYEFTEKGPPLASNPSDQYPLYSVAMANSNPPNDTDPNTNGSQFFIVTGSSGESLPPDYVLFGQVTSGMSVVQTINNDGSATGVPPTVTHRMLKVTIAES